MQAEHAHEEECVKSNESREESIGNNKTMPVLAKKSRGRQPKRAINDELSKQQQEQGEGTKANDHENVNYTSYNENDNELNAASSSKKMKLEHGSVVQSSTTTTTTTSRGRKSKTKEAMLSLGDDALYNDHSRSPSTSLNMSSRVKSDTESICSMTQTPVIDTSKIQPEVSLQVLETFFLLYFSQRDQEN